MRKTDKKREQIIISALQDVCEKALDCGEPAGFEWLTHNVNHQKPQTLTVTCVFTTREQAQNASGDSGGQGLAAQIRCALTKVGIKLVNPLQFDSEQACDAEHAGNWKRRLSRH